MRLVFALFLTVSAVSPVQKVLQMLQDMRAKGVQEKQDEQVKFAAYTQFCEDTEAEKKSNIADADADIEQFQADIQKAQSDAAVLASEIADLDRDINTWAADKSEATKVRKTDESDFSDTHRDYSESVDALTRAIATLKAQSYDRKQATELLQKVSVLTHVTKHAKKVIAAFLATDSEISDPLSVSAPEANSYEFQSGGVVDMLQSLKDKFEDERATLEKEELNGKHAFQLMAQELEDSIKAAENERSEKAGTKAQREEAAAAASGDLSDTSASRAEDQKYLDTLVAQCSQKSTDFELRQQLRSEELEAIQKASEIISQQSVSGSAEKHLDVSQRITLALRASSAKSPLQKNVAAFLQGRSTKLQSRVLSLVAMQIADSPFDKVKQMIDSMITRLLEEANEEEDHKGYCDTEMAKSKHTRDTKTDEVSALQAQVDQLNAEISRAAQQASDLTAAIQEIDAAVGKATSVREGESAKNKQTLEEAQDGQTAVAQALAVLKEFYAKAGAGAENLKMGYDGETRASLLQGPESDAPETFSESYTGMGDNAGGVVGMLEVIESDFSRLAAETQSAESTSAKDFERFSVESAKDKAVKTADLEHKIKSKTQKESDLNDTKKDLAGTIGELDAALVYYEKLKPSCEDATTTYDDRGSKREAEIESLKEALKILS